MAVPSEHVHHELSFSVGPEGEQLWKLLRCESTSGGHQNWKLEADGSALDRITCQTQAFAAAAKLGLYMTGGSDEEGYRFVLPPRHRR
jgi:hypothetical protein